VTTKPPSPTALSEQEVLYSCKLLYAVADAINRVAENPQLTSQLTTELLTKSPQILDALLTITQPKFRVVVYDLAESVLKLVKIWPRTTR